jgi:hypothetical protein
MNSTRLKAGFKEQTPDAIHNIFDGTGWIMFPENAQTENISPGIFSERLDYRHGFEGKIKDALGI